MSQKPEGSDRTAERQGQPPHSVLSWTPLSSPGSSGRRNSGTACCLSDLSLGSKGRALGHTEMQDRLHILEDLNMLYIRQMALSLEVMP